MYKEKNVLQKVYGWIGFVVFWSMFVFMVWSLICQDDAINLLVKIFG